MACFVSAFLFPETPHFISFVTRLSLFPSCADSVHLSGLELGVIIIIRSKLRLEGRARAVALGMDKLNIWSIHQFTFV